MSQTAWRIATETPAFEADNLSGTGAKVSGGRWNTTGVAVVYTSQTRAPACVETIVHLNASGLPFNRYLVEVTIPDGFWGNAQVTTAASPPVGWDAEPAGRASIEFCTNRMRSGSSALLVVPSVMVPEEFNVLINPQHPENADHYREGPKMALRSPADQDPLTADRDRQAPHSKGTGCRLRRPSRFSFPGRAIGRVLSQRSVYSGSRN